MELCQDPALGICPAMQCGITSIEPSSLLFSALLWLHHASIGNVLSLISHTLFGNFQVINQRVPKPKSLYGRKEKYGKLCCIVRAGHTLICVW